MIAECGSTESDVDHDDHEGRDRGDHLRVGHQHLSTGRRIAAASRSVLDPAKQIRSVIRTVCTGHRIAGS
eukprot:286451-Rhodomonas_salina.2